MFLFILLFLFFGGGSGGDYIGGRSGGGSKRSRRLEDGGDDDRRDSRGGRIGRNMMRLHTLVILQMRRAEATRVRSGGCCYWLLSQVMNTLEISGLFS